MILETNTMDQFLDQKDEQPNHNVPILLIRIKVGLQHSLSAITPREVTWRGATCTPLEHPVVTALTVQAVMRTFLHSVLEYGISLNKSITWSWLKLFTVAELDKTNISLCLYMLCVLDIRILFNNLKDSVKNIASTSTFKPCFHHFCRLLYKILYSPYFKKCLHMFGKMLKISLWSKIT